MIVRIVIIVVLCYNHLFAQSKDSSAFIVIPTLEVEMRNCTSVDELLSLYTSFETNYPEKKFGQLHFLLDKIYVVTAEKMISWNKVEAIQYIIKIHNYQDRSRLMNTLPVEYWQSNSIDSIYNQYVIDTKDSEIDLLRQNIVYAEILNYSGNYIKSLEFLEEKGETEKLIVKNPNLFIQLYRKNKRPQQAIPIVSNIIRSGRGTQETKQLLYDIWKEALYDINEFEDYYQEQLNYIRREKSVHLESRKLSYKAPDFDLKDLRGNSVTLSDLKGKIVFLDFWATWCKPCLASFPSMQRVLNLYKKNKDVFFLFVNTMESSNEKFNRESRIRDILKDMNLDFQVILDKQLDSKFELATKYKVGAIPAQFIIDQSGNVCYELKGFDGSSDGLVQEIDLLLQSLLNNDDK